MNYCDVQATLIGVESSSLQRRVRKLSVPSRSNGTPAAPPSKGRREERSSPMVERYCDSSVFAAAIRHDHFVVRALSTDCVEQRRKCLLLIQGRNDNRDHQNDRSADPDGLCNRLNRCRMRRTWPP